MKDSTENITFPQFHWQVVKNFTGMGGSVRSDVCFPLGPFLLIFKKFLRKFGKNNRLAPQSRLANSGSTTNWDLFAHISLLSAKLNVK